MNTVAKIDPKETPLSVAMPGGVWTKTGFVVFDAASEAQLCRAVRQMSALNMSSRWALGDLGIAIQERKQKEFQAEADALREQFKAIPAEDGQKRNRVLKQIEELEESRIDEYTNELSETLGVDAGYWRNCVRLARFYSASHRCDALTPAHHEAAMMGSGGSKDRLATAQQWIAQATKDSLSASELRKRVNMERATARPPKAPPEVNVFEALDEADQWAIAHKEFIVAPEHREQLRVRFAALIEWFGKLCP